VKFPTGGSAQAHANLSDKVGRAQKRTPALHLAPGVKARELRTSGAPAQFAHKRMLAQYLLCARHQSSAGCFPWCVEQIWYNSRADGVKEADVKTPNPIGWIGVAVSRQVQMKEDFYSHARRSSSGCLFYGGFDAE